MRRLKKEKRHESALKKKRQKDKKGDPVAVKIYPLVLSVLVLTYSNKEVVAEQKKERKTRDT